MKSMTDRLRLTLIDRDGRRHHPPCEVDGAAHEPHSLQRHIQQMIAAAADAAPAVDEHPHERISEYGTEVALADSGQVLYYLTWAALSGESC